MPRVEEIVNREEKKWRESSAVYLRRMGECLWGEGIECYLGGREVGTASVWSGEKGYLKQGE